MANEEAGSTAVHGCGSLFGIIGAIIGVPIAAAIEVVLDEATAGRRARIAAADPVLLVAASPRKHPSPRIRRSEVAPV
jgi:hypothetical protein